MRRGRSTKEWRAAVNRWREEQGLSLRALAEKLPKKADGKRFSSTAVKYALSDDQPGRKAPESSEVVVHLAKLSGIPLTQDESLSDLALAVAPLLRRFEGASEARKKRVLRAIEAVLESSDPEEP